MDKGDEAAQTGGLLFIEVGLSAAFG